MCPSDGTKVNFLSNESRKFTGNDSNIRRYIVAISHKKLSTFFVEWKYFFIINFISQKPLGARLLLCPEEALKDSIGCKYFLSVQ